MSTRTATNIRFILFWLMAILVIIESQSDDVSTALNGSNSSLLTSNDRESNLREDTHSTQQWDVKLHALGQKLEKDLEKVERHTQERVTSEETVNVGSSFADAEASHDQHNNATLNQDLNQIKSDIHDIVQSIQNAQEEIQRARAKMNNEEKVIMKKSAEMDTEKILDDLHRGKLNMKVDYVTGQLVSSQKERRREKRSTTVEEDKNLEMPMEIELKSAITDTETTIDTTTTAAAITTTKESFKTTTGENSALDREDEKVLNEIVDAASSVLKPDAANNDDDKAVTEKAKASENVIQQLEDNPDLKIRVQEEIKSLRSDSDPAVLSMDFQLLLDVVKLAMTASLFGLAAVFMRLPPTAGFLMGGMLIGPSCLELIGEIHQVQTLAQFGMIFLLFEQGLLYSLTYSGTPVLTAGRSSDDEESEFVEDDDEKSVSSTTTQGQSNNSKRVHSRRLQGKSLIKPDFIRNVSSSNFDTDRDPNVVGAVVLVLLILTAAAIVYLTEVVSSIPEAIIVSCAIAVCSTTIVSENLHAAKIADTQWGKGVLKMISMHDLFMVPLLALPELLASLNHLQTDDGEKSDMHFALFGVVNILFQLGIATVFLRGSMILAKNIISAANLAEAKMVGEKSELFTLSVVAYALLIATMSDQLKLSIEAGAVLAGVALMRSPYVPKVIASIAPITSVFGGMYLTSLGTILSPAFVFNHASEIIELVLLIGLFKLVLVATTLNRVFDYRITSSLAVGSAMAQVSEVSLLVLAKAQRIGLVSRKTYLLLIPTTCVLLTLAPFSASHLRRLKLQEVAGADDGKIPFYLCFLNHFHILRHPKTRNNQNYPPQRSLSIELEGESNFLHNT